MPDLVPGMWRRMAALAYEVVLLTGVLLLTLILPHLLIGAFAHHVAPPAVLWAHLVLILLCYFVGFWSQGGQTLAMKTWRIRLVSGSGQPVSPAQALRRFFWCWPSLSLCGAGWLWAFFDPDGQFLHDRLAGTRLVRVR